MQYKPTKLAANSIYLFRTGGCTLHTNEMANQHKDTIAFNAVMELKKIMIRQRKLRCTNWHWYCANVPFYCIGDVDALIIGLFLLYSNSWNGISPLRYPPISRASPGYQFTILNFHTPTKAQRQCDVIKFYAMQLSVPHIDDSLDMYILC